MILPSIDLIPIKQPEILRNQQRDKLLRPMVEERPPPTRVSSCRVVQDLVSDRAVGVDLVLEHHAAVEHLELGVEHLALPQVHAYQACLPEGEADPDAEHGRRGLGQPGEAQCHAQQVAHVVLGLTHHAAGGTGLRARVPVAPPRIQVEEAVFGPDRA